MRRGLGPFVASMAAMALAGCQGMLPQPVGIDEPVEPLSRVYVKNGADGGHHVR
jgi:hypothetical protein